MNLMTRSIFFLVLLLLTYRPGYSQAITQIVKGKITDNSTHQKLQGASVKISKLDFDRTTITDEEGYFEFLNVPTGRYQFQISYTGYTSINQELLVIAAHQAIIDIGLSESSVLLNEVVVGTSSIDQNIPGLQSVTIEKTMRVPANFFDPVRMITTYPGIVAASDQGNSIIVRGNSPNGLLWRLNGLDIVNPNHLANAGTLSDKPMANGGGVNILSAQMLDRTDFYTGNFPANYGNALSGVVDMRLRNGNSDKVQYTAQASLIGLDLAAEGPLTKKHNTSFAANYRYSTVGLLSKLGIDFGGEIIDFQDFSFNLNRSFKKGATLSLFGFGGLSKNQFKEREQAEWREDKDHNNIDYDANTYALGLNYVKPLKGGIFYLAMGYSSTDQERNLEASQLYVNAGRSLRSEHYSLLHSILSSNIHYQKKLSSKINWEIGLIGDYITDELNSFKKFDSDNTQSELIDGSSGKWLLQPYTNFNAKLFSKLDLNVGIRYVSYTQSSTDSFEPRILLSYQPISQASFSLSYGIVSQVQLPFVNFGNGNQNLGLNKAHHLAASFRQSLTKSLKFNTEVYYQKLFDIPITSNSSSFSTINLLEGYVPASLVNNGLGENYGINATIEKSFYAAHYFMIGGSMYESNYTPSDGIKRYTRFNGKFTFNATYGKEWTSQKNNRTIGLNTRLLYLGGLRETPINAGLSQAAGETVRDETNPFSNKLNDYFRIDLRLSFRKNKPGYTRTLAFDLQNITGQQNEAYHYYDFTQAKVVTKYQLGLIPVIVYRIDF